MSKKFKVPLFIDIDNTVASLIEHFLSVYTVYFGTKFPKDVMESFDTLDFPTFTQRFSGNSIEMEVARQVRIFESHGFWEYSYPPYKDAVSTIKKLYDQYDLYFLTAPSFKTADFFNERVYWVAKWFPFFDLNKLIFSCHKDVFMSDSILIDDMPQNLSSWRGKKLKVNFKFNENYECASFNCNEWKKVPKLLKSL